MSVAHQSTTATAGRHQAVTVEALAELLVGWTIPQLGQRGSLDVADDVIVVVAARRDVAIAVDLDDLVDRHALVEPERGTVIGVVRLQVRAAGNRRNDADGRCR